MATGTGSQLPHLETAIPSLQYPNISPVPDDATSPRHQRRRLDAPQGGHQNASPTGFSAGSAHSGGQHAGALTSPQQRRYSESASEYPGTARVSPILNADNERRDSFRAGSPDEHTPSDDGDEHVDLADVVGQLSIDENDQVSLVRWKCCTGLTGCSSGSLPWKSKRAASA
jgi:hypothetical protein